MDKPINLSIFLTGAAILTFPGVFQKWLSGAVKMSGKKCVLSFAWAFRIDRKWVLEKSDFSSKITFFFTQMFLSRYTLPNFTTRCRSSAFLARLPASGLDADEPAENEGLGILNFN